MSFHDPEYLTLVLPLARARPAKLVVALLHLRVARATDVDNARVIAVHVVCLLYFILLVVPRLRCGRLRSDGEVLHEARERLVLLARELRVALLRHALELGKVLPAPR